MPIFPFLFVIIIVLGAYFGAHYFLYYSFIRLFEIANPTSKVVILCIVILLSLVFFLSMLAAHYWEGAFTRGFYAISSFWLGLFLYLFLAVLASWLILWAAGLFGFHPSSILVTGLFFAAALVVSGYGVWNAFHPRVKNINVAIKNLPAGWKGKNIVQLSDVHLGHIYRADFLEKVVEKTNSLHPDMVVITGDLFDGMDGDLENLIGPINNLKVPDGIYFVTGNHETYLGVDKAFSALEKTKVTILNDAVKNINGLQLVGVSYPERVENIDVAKKMQTLAGYQQGAPTILLYHSPVQIEAIKNAGVNLQLSGHTHKGQLFPFNFITSLIYKGYDYGLFKLGDYSLYTSDGVGTWGPPMRVGNTPEIVNITLE